MAAALVAPARGLPEWLTSAIDDLRVEAERGGAAKLATAAPAM